MARSRGDRLYDKSDKIENMREAAKGDVKKRHEIMGTDDDGDTTEYESKGLNPRSVPKDEPEAGSSDDHDRSEKGDISDLTLKGRGELWRPRKRAVPTS